MANDLASVSLKVLASLADPTETRYTDDMITQGLREALTEYSVARPRTRIATQASDGKKAIAVTVAGFNAISIDDVRTDQYDSTTRIPFYAYRSDGAWMIETTEQKYDASKDLFIFYSAPHTLKDLDSAATSTYPIFDEELLVKGGAGYAALYRGSKIGEGVKLDSAAAINVRDLSMRFLAEFRSALGVGSKVTFAQWPPPR